MMGGLARENKGKLECEIVGILNGGIETGARSRRATVSSITGYEDATESVFMGNNTLKSPVARLENINIKIRKL